MSYKYFRDVHNDRAIWKQQRKTVESDMFDELEYMPRIRNITTNLLTQKHNNYRLDGSISSLLPFGVSMPIVPMRERKSEMKYMRELNTVSGEAWNLGVNRKSRSRQHHAESIGRKISDAILDDLMPGDASAKELLSLSSSDHQHIKNRFESGEDQRSKEGNLMQILGRLKHPNIVSEQEHNSISHATQEDEDAEDAEVKVDQSQTADSVTNLLRSNPSEMSTPLSTRQSLKSLTSQSATDSKISYRGHYIPEEIMSTTKELQQLRQTKHTYKRLKDQIKTISISKTVEKFNLIKQAKVTQKPSLLSLIDIQNSRLELHKIIYDMENSSLSDELKSSKQQQQKKTASSSFNQLTSLPHNKAAQIGAAVTAPKRTTTAATTATNFNKQIRNSDKK